MAKKKKKKDSFSQKEKKIKIQFHKKRGDKKKRRGIGEEVGMAAL